MLSHIYHLILIFQKPGKVGMAENRIPIWQMNRGRKRLRDIKQLA